MIKSNQLVKAKVKSNWKQHRHGHFVGLPNITSIPHHPELPWHPWHLTKWCYIIPPIESTLALKRETFSRLIIMQWISKTNTRSRFSKHALFWNWLKSPLGLIVQTNLIKCVLYQPDILHLCRSSMSGPIETSPNTSPPCFPPQLSNCSLNGAAEPAG